MVATGGLRLDGSVGLDELVAQVGALPGIGPWTAHAIARRLGERKAFPADPCGRRTPGVQISGARPPSLTTSTPWSRSAASKASGSSGVTNGLTALPTSTKKAAVLPGRRGSKLAQ